MTGEHASRFRGYDICEIDGSWFFCDTGLPVASTWQDRPCGHCNAPNTPDGHDACIGQLNDVRNACCGHGEPTDAYVQFADGQTIHGHAALDIMRALVTPDG